MSIIASPIYQPVAQNVASGSSVFNAEKESKIKKVNSLKKAIQEHNSDKEEDRILQNSMLLVSSFTPLICMLGTVICMLASEVHVEKHAEYKKITSQGVILGSGLTLTAWSIKVFVNGLFKILSFEDDNRSLVEDKKFHEFVIDRCKINANSSDIESLKNLYYKDLASKIF